MKQLNHELETAIGLALQSAQADGQLPTFEIPEIPVSPPKRAGQGDLSYPAMGLAKLAHKKPFDIAKLIVERMPALDFIDHVDVVAPGFINCVLSVEYLKRQVDAIIVEGEDFFRLELGKGKTAQVEFVSANPSGPITIGHTRGAVIGDAMARLLETAGYQVQREYYYNNAGNQMMVLGKSLMLRYLQQLGDDVTFPANYYRGEYLIEVAADLVVESADSLRDETWESFKDIAENRMFDWINRSLASVDIKHDDFYNETSLFESELIWQVLNTMRENGHIYESTHWDGDEIADVKAKGYKPATWFRSTTFGDEKDRVMVKSDGVPTYTLPDIAYHCDKLKRGFEIAVNVLGTDHFSQAAVVKHGIRAMNMNPDPIHVIFIQMVRAVRWNAELEKFEAVKQSKRAGDFDTLDDLVEMTSADAVRYHMLARSPNSQLDFDVDQVIKQTNENPVYYIQNAYVRCAGIFREAEERGFNDDEADLSLLGADEFAFIRKALELGNVIEQAVVNYEPHKIAFYAHELATVFHPIYDKVRVLHSEGTAKRGQSTFALLPGSRRRLLSRIAIDGHVGSGSHVSRPSWR